MSWCTPQSPQMVAPRLLCGIFSKVHSIHDLVVSGKAIALYIQNLHTLKVAFTRSPPNFHRSRLWQESSKKNFPTQTQWTIVWPLTAGSLSPFLLHFGFTLPVQPVNVRDFGRCHFLCYSGLKLISDYFHNCFGFLVSNEYFAGFSMKPLKEAASRSHL